jgi:hypothetical protein
MHEYNWPAATGDSATAISLVLKDGSVRLAAAVWVQDDTVNYTPRDGSAGLVPASVIDREATRRVNAQAGLNVSLP